MLISDLEADAVRTLQGLGSFQISPRSDVDSGGPFANGLYAPIVLGTDEPPVIAAERRGDQGRVGHAAVGPVGGEVGPHGLHLAGCQLLGAGFEPLGDGLELGGERVARPPVPDLAHTVPPEGVRSHNGSGILRHASWLVTVGPCVIVQLGLALGDRCGQALP